VIEPKLAVQFAMQSLLELVGSRELADVEGIHLEELALSDDSKTWEVTVSYPVKVSKEQTGTQEQVQDAYARLVGTPRRKWRTLRIDSADGKLISMKLVGRQTVDQSAT
jgi:hypothetical protein